MIDLSSSADTGFLFASAALFASLTGSPEALPSCGISTKARARPKAAAKALALVADALSFPSPIALVEGQGLRVWWLGLKIWVFVSGVWGLGFRAKG